MSGHVDAVHPEIMVTMRANMSGSGMSVKSVEGFSDEEVLGLYEQEYPGGVEGYKADIGAKP